MKKEQTAVEETKGSKYPNESLQRIEDSRLVFWNSYKLHNTFKFIVMFVCLVGIIVAFVVSKNKPNLQFSLTAVVAIAALGGMYGYSLYVRKKFEKKMKVYFDFYYETINTYVFEDKIFSDVELQKPGKITVEEFNECKLYKDVIESGSRGLTTLKIAGKEASIVDCAGNVKAEKRMKPVFVGKMVRSSASYKGEIPVMVYLKGNDRALPPTNVSEVKNVLEDQKLVVYSDYKDWKKVLNGTVMKAIESIKTDKLLVDVAISIYGGKVFVMMGYDDPLMILPLQTEFDYKPTDTYKKDVFAVAKLIEALNK